jgi:hypothetical protein
MKLSHFLKGLPLLLLLFFSGRLSVKGQKQDDPVLHLGVIGLVHDHVSWIFNRQKPDIKIVGIVETNPATISKYKKRYQLADSLFLKVTKLYTKRGVLMLFQHSILHNYT